MKEYLDACYPQYIEGDTRHQLMQLYKDRIVVSFGLGCL